MIKPPKIFFTFLLICAVFLCISVLFPSGVIPLGNQKLRWVSLKDTKNLFYKEETIIENSPSVNLDTLIVLKDTIEATELVDSSLIHKFKGEEDLQLEYSDEFKPLLQSFYSKILTANSSGKVIRVLHFGDSQIEGDRITRYLRASFQKDFGGTGPGFIPLYDPHKHFSSVWISNTGDWKEHAVYKYPREIPNNEYGLVGKVNTIKSPGWASIKVSTAPSALPSAKEYYHSRMFVKNIESPLLVDAYWGNTLISSDSLKQESDITEINWSFKQTPKRFTVKLNASDSPLFLGMTLDSLSGIAVDNIAMRGQSTPRLDKTNKELFKAMASHLDIGMIILQYGTNMVPTVAKNYHFYYRMLYKQLLTLKETIPNVPVVIVGVGDVAFEDEGSVSSYSHVYDIKEAQKKAAVEAGFAFFDLYEVMGGKGAIIKWANGVPHLAMSDYTHFNKRGGEKVAEWIYKSIMSDFSRMNSQTIVNE